MNKKIKLCLSYIFEFLFSVSLFILLFSFVASKTIFNKDYILNELDNNNFYEKVYESTYDEMSNYLIPSGIPEDVLIDTFTKDSIKIVMTETIDNIFSNKKIIIDLSSFENQLRTNIENYFSKNNLVITDEKAIDEFVAQMSNIYQEELTFSNVIPKVQNLYYKLMNYLNKGIKFILIITIILFLINTFIFKNGALATAFITSGLLFLIVYLFIINNIDIKNLIIYSKSISNVIQNVAFSILNSYKLYGIILIILGIVCCILRFFIFPKEEKAKKKTKTSKK